MEKASEGKQRETVGREENLIKRGGKDIQSLKGVFTKTKKRRGMTQREGRKGGEGLDGPRTKTTKNLLRKGRNATAGTSIACSDL